MLNELFCNGTVNICNLKNTIKVLLTFFYSECQCEFHDETANYYYLPDKDPPEKCDPNFTNDKSQHCVQTINNHLILDKIFKKADLQHNHH